MKQRHTYHVYILLCADGSYYTGMSGDIEKRLEEHYTGIYPSCYTYSRRPVTLKYIEIYQMVYDAISREKQIKRWSRKKKEALIEENYEELKRLSKNRMNDDGDV